MHFFSKYIRNNFKSIRTNITYEFIYRAEALAQTLSATNRQSLYGSNTDLQPPTPRKHWMCSPSVDVPTEMNTSFNTLSPADYDAYPTKIR